VPTTRPPGPVSRLVRSSLRRRKRRRRRQERRRAFDREFLPALPPELRPAAEFAYRRDATEDERRIADTVEALRGELERAEGTALSYSSPHSGSFRRADGGHVAPGPANRSTLEAHAKTGAGPRGGILLRRLAEGLDAKNVLELGTNTGFSGMYLLSAAPRPRLVTIEGSADLCRIAEQNLARVADGARFRVINRLFDEALDELEESGERFSCAFIDGQHEQAATLHYTARVVSLLEPGGAVILDDIYWSRDMHDAWQRLQVDNRFAVTCDLKWKGVCITGEGPPRAHDICNYIRRPPFARGDW
jgi:predicted O-methyltransferase YrrM